MNDFPEAVALRCSGLPLAFRCAGSVHDVGMRVSEQTPPAGLGSAAHVALRQLAEIGSIDWDTLPAIALAHDSDVDELRMLCAMAVKMWPGLAPSFPDARTEVELADSAIGYELTGHLDALALCAEVARFLDWKTGRKDHDYLAQVMGYASLIFSSYPATVTVTGTLVWLRSGEIENYTITRKQIVAWNERLESEVVAWSGAYRSGTHCEWCPRSHDCPAANALARRDVAAFLDVDVSEAVGRMTAGDAISLVEKAAQVERMAKRVREVVKERVIEHGDIVADGQRLTVETERHRRLDVLKAWPVLEESGFENEDFAKCVKLSVTAVESVVAKKAARGKGAGAVRTLKTKLTDAGAVALDEVQKLSIKREGTSP